LFGPVSVVAVPEMDDEFGFITEVISEAEFKEKVGQLEGVINMIRVQD